MDWGDPSLQDSNTQKRCTIYRRAAPKEGQEPGSGGDQLWCCQEEELNLTS